MNLMKRIKNMFATRRKHCINFGRVNSYGNARHLLLQRPVSKGIRCENCKWLSMQPADPEKGICRRYSAKSVLLYVKRADRRTCLEIDIKKQFVLITARLRGRSHYAKNKNETWQKTG